VKCVPVFARTHTQYNYMYIVQCTCKSDANHVQTHWAAELGTPDGLPIAFD
jgi:hypothetical protein